MKRKLLVLFLLVTNTMVCTAAIAYRTDTLVAVNDEHPNELAILGRIWGLLKYHHPAVIKGSLNWDEELMKILSAYTNAKSKGAKDQLLLTWVKSLGEVPKNQPMPDSVLVGAKLVPSYQWINKSGLSLPLVKMLTNISNYHLISDQHYIKYLSEDDINLPSIVNEEAYPGMTYPAANYRLLAVFRYWNIIEYWYPYKYLARQKWDDCLVPFIKQALAAGNEPEYIRFIQKMVGTIQDSHAIVISRRTEELNGTRIMPLTLKFIEGKAVVTSVNQKQLAGASIDTGDILKAINGISVDEIVKERTPYVSASNASVVLRNLALLINRTPDSVSKLTITNASGLTRVFSVSNKVYSPYSATKTYEFNYQHDSAYIMLPGNILYINVGAFKSNQVNLVKPYFKSIKGMVLDARQYPRGGAGSVVSVLQQSLLPGPAAMAKFSTVIKGYPGLFKFAKPFLTGETNANYFKGTVAILVNEETQSTGEFLTMAYQLVPKAVVVGSTTAGADGNVLPYFPLPGGFMTTITGLGVYYPNGKETQQVGIKADVEVKPTIKGFRSHKDELLDKAIELINRGQ